MSDKESCKLNDFHLHEALDRSFVLLEMLNQYVLSHPVIENNVELKLKAEKAHQLLFDIYQQIGAMMTNDNK